MKQFFVLALCLLVASNLSAQANKIEELVIEGVQHHDQGRYDEAIAKYKAALKLDKNSTLANYELAFSYFASKQYDDAIKYCNKVIKQKKDNQHEAYVVLGSSLDMKGEVSKAIKTFQKGLKKFPNSNPLNYNLAVTYFNQNDDVKAEKALINSIKANPNHGSSHIILSAIMQNRGERVKTILPLYYFLMTEPNSQRSLNIYNTLKNELNKGVEKKDDKNISILVPSSPNISTEFGAAEIALSLVAATQFTEENEGKNEMDLFVDANRTLFGILGELKKDNSGFWWDLYVTKFYDLVQSNNIEAFSYLISVSTNSELVNNWITTHTDELQQLLEWLEK